MSNAPTTKVQNMIDEGLEVEYGSDYKAIASEAELENLDNMTGEYYVTLGYKISYHKGLMPSFQTETYETLQELADAMRKIADLRTWRKLQLDY